MKWILSKENRIPGFPLLFCILFYVHDWLLLKNCCWFFTNFILNDSNSALLKNNSFSSSHFNVFQKSPISEKEAPFLQFSCNLQSQPNTIESRNELLSNINPKKVVLSFLLFHESLSQGSIISKNAKYWQWFSLT